MLATRQKVEAILLESFAIFGYFSFTRKFLSSQRKPQMVLVLFRHMLVQVLCVFPFRLFTALSAVLHIGNVEFVPVRATPNTAFIAISTIRFIFSGVN